MSVLKLLKVLPAVLVAACAGHSDQSATHVSSVFENLSRYVGEQVEVCGYVRTSFEESNIWLDRRSMREGYGSGLGFIASSAALPTSETTTKYGCFFCGGGADRVRRRTDLPVDQF